MLKVFFLLFFEIWQNIHKGCPLMDHIVVNVVSINKNDILFIFVYSKNKFTHSTPSRYFFGCPNWKCNY